MIQRSMESQPQNPEFRNNLLFVAVFLGCTSTCRVGFCFLWFYVQELPKAQPAVVLVLKCLRRWGNGLKTHPTDWEKPGIELAGIILKTFTSEYKHFLACLTIIKA